MPVSRLNFEDYRTKNETLDGLVAQAFTPVNLSGGSGDPEQILAEIVSPGYFAVLGSPMAIGRAFSTEEEQTIGAAPVTVLGYSLWQRRFGGDPAILGRSITLNARSFTVIGVTPEAFKGTNVIGGGQLWLPFAMYRETTSGFLLDNWDSRRALNYQLTGRLKPGVSVQQASANLNTIASSLARSIRTTTAGAASRSFRSPSRPSIQPSAAT